MTKPIMRCEFLGFVTAFGDPVTKLDIRPAYGLRARVKRLEDHPRLGPADGHDFTITSEVSRIDFDVGMIVTKNSVYLFK